MIELLIGCPVRQRNWVMPTWRDHVLAAIPDDINARFVFVVGEDDLGTIEMLSSWHGTTLIPVVEPSLGLNRDWGNSDRYHHMVYLRNTLLKYARVQHPDFFLSLDSDILLGTNTISQLVDTARERDYDAVGGLTWLDRVDKTCTNLGQRRPGSSIFKRVVSTGTHEVDFLMAIKLMKPSAYNVDYEFNKFGEDIGWSLNAKDKFGLRLGMDGRTANKHIMHEDDLSRVDKRVGW